MPVESKQLSLFIRRGREEIKAIRGMEKAM